MKTSIDLLQSIGIVCLAAAQFYTTKTIRLLMQAEAHEGQLMTDEYVWVVERGCYESLSIAGVYATIEAAIADNPVPENYRFPDAPSAFDASTPTGWEQETEDRWGNGMDWDYAATATRMKVQ